MGNDGCNGGLMDTAFAYVKSAGGLCTEQEYAYKAKTEVICRERFCATKAGKITGFTDVDPNNEQALMEAVAEGPVSVAIEADRTASNSMVEACSAELAARNLTTE